MPKQVNVRLSDGDYARFEALKKKLYPKMTDSSFALDLVFYALDEYEARHRHDGNSLADDTEIRLKAVEARLEAIELNLRTVEIIGSLESVGKNTNHQTIESIEPIESRESVALSNNVEPVDSVENIESVDSIDSIDSVDNSEPDRIGNIEPDRTDRAADVDEAKDVQQTDTLFAELKPDQTEVTGSEIIPLPFDDYEYLKQGDLRIFLGFKGNDGTFSQAIKKGKIDLGNWEKLEDKDIRKSLGFWFKPTAVIYRRPVV